MKHPQSMNDDTNVYYVGLLIGSLIGDWVGVWVHVVHYIVHGWFYWARQLIAPNGFS